MVKTRTKYLCPTCEKEFDTPEEAAEHHGFPRTITMYLHGNKENNWNDAKDLRLDDDKEFMGGFSHTLYEVKFELEVYRDGTSKIIAVDGRKVEDNE